MQRKSPINLLREFSVPLMGGIVAALIWANLSPGSYHKLVHTPFWGPLSFHFLVNDLFMVFFFGIAAVEITDAFRPGGNLYPPAKAVSPLLATAGGVLGPAAVYLGLNTLFGGPRLTRGWGIGTATDIALAWLVARIVFGRLHPAVSFLLLLAVADDGIGLAIIAVFYPDPGHSLSWPPLLLLAAGILVALVLRRLRVNSYWPYLTLGGGAAWSGLFLAHLHPALALVFVIPFLPHKVHPRGENVFDVRFEERSALSRFEHDWRVVVDFGLLLFGLANAGVEFSSVGLATIFVLSSLVAGKTGGIFALALLAKRLGFPLPDGVGTKELLLMAFIAGIGLTVALFVASVAFADQELQGAAKMGALLSALVAPCAIALGRLAGIRPVAANLGVTAATEGEPKPSHEGH